ncbi:MAG: hypothetical protein RM368_07190 [Nostoc sp. DedSLP03]|nr:hypothetical protein [Nostoc sp. DedSLP03]MDZ7964749.1 hypothetical protein [Nostoc sp. DedSLP03]
MQKWIFWDAIAHYTLPERSKMIQVQGFSFSGEFILDLGQV